MWPVNLFSLVPQFESSELTEHLLLYCTLTTDLGSFLPVLRLTCPLLILTSLGTVQNNIFPL